MPLLRFSPRIPSIRTHSTLPTPSYRLNHLRPTLPFTYTTNVHARAISTIPYTPTCPVSTCVCTPTPPNLDIDRKTPLLNTMAPYAHHIVVCSGKADWSSRIEDEPTSAGDFVRGLKGIIGKGGPRFDPFNNIVTTLSSFPTPTITTPATSTTSLLLFPSFTRIDNIPNDASSLAALAAAYLSPTTLHPFHAAAPLTPHQQANLLRDESLADKVPSPAAIQNPVIFICSHGGRDQRCGILGPILQASFHSVLAAKGVQADVGLISHVGGHKFAGNVIIYLPPGSSTQGTEGDKDTGEGKEGGDLAGTGLWYGRVGPENVEGIVDETIVRGRVIAELFRGGVTRDGENLGRVLEAQIKRENREEEGLKLRPRAR